MSPSWRLSVTFNSEKESIRAESGFSGYDARIHYTREVGGEANLVFNHGRYRCVLL